MRKKLTGVTLITVMAVLICASLLFVVAMKSPISGLTDKDAASSTAYTTLETNDALRTWINNPSFDAQLVANKRYEIVISNFSNVELGKTLEGNGAIVVMKSAKNLEVTSIDTKTAEYGLLFWKIQSSGELRNIRIENNVNVTLTLLQAHYWQGVTGKGQEAFYIGGIAGSIMDGGVIENCEITHNGVMQVLNQVDKDGPTSTKETYAFVSPLAGHCAGEINYCTVIENGKILIDLTKTPSNRAWHVWSTVAATFAGKLEGAGAKMLNNTVDIRSAAVYESNGLFDGFGSRISFFIGQYMSGSINGVLYRNIPALTDNNFTHKRFDNNNKVFIVEQNLIYTYVAYGNPSITSVRIYNTSDVSMEGLKINLGVTAKYTTIPAEFTPKWVLGNNDVIELDLTTRYKDTAGNKIAYSINAATCYEQLSSSTVYAKKWYSDQNGMQTLNIKDGVLMESKIEVAAQNAMVYDGNVIKDFSGLINLFTTDSGGNVKETIAANKYIPNLNMAAVKDAGEYILYGARMVNGSKIIAHSSSGVEASIWTTDKIKVTEGKETFVIDKKGLSFNVAGKSIFDANIRLVSGLVDGDTVELPISPTHAIRFESNGETVNLNDTRYSGTISAGAAIGRNYRCNNEIIVDVNPHKIILPKNIKVILLSGGEMSLNPMADGRLELQINTLLESVELEAQVVDYGSVYRNWEAKNSKGVVVENAFGEIINTNSMVFVELKELGSIDTVVVEYAKREFYVNISAADMLKGSVNVTKNGNQQKIGFTGEFGDQIAATALPANNYVFSHWSNGINGKVYSYSNAISFKLYEEYDLKANFAASDDALNAKLIFHDIAGEIMYEKAIEAGSKVAYYMSNSGEVAYPYEELFKQFKEWYAAKDLNYIVTAGDKIDVYPTFFTTKTVEIVDKTRTIESGSYYFNHTITLKEGEYSINGFNITAPKGGLKFNAINNLIIDYKRSEQPPEQERKVISQLVMERNNWYFIATMPSAKDYKSYGFILHLENKTTGASRDVSIKRYIRYGDINNNYIYQFIVKIDRDLMAFIGNDAEVTIEIGKR